MSSNSRTDGRRRTSRALLVFVQIVAFVAYAIAPITALAVDPVSPDPSASSSPAADPSATPDPSSAPP
ncbi:MAG: hypothetical protein ABI578_09415, partial [Chloroflexota bacterium]